LLGYRLEVPSSRAQSKQAHSCAPSTNDENLTVPA
jgi:hypothetical protein